MAKPTLEIRVVSIGTLASHPLWDERGAVRTPHATTTLIRSGERVILVDPGLPEQLISARLRERAGIEPAAVTHVFLTSFRPDTTRGLVGFERATWWVSQAEREGVGVPLVAHLQEAAAAGDAELKAALELDVALLRRCQPAPDRLAPHVDIFPLHGVTPGLTGVLVAAPAGVGGGGGATTLICGDAIPTVEHLERGIVLQSATDPRLAQDSFAEAVEIADHLILGRDNFVVNPVRGRFRARNEAE